MLFIELWQAGHYQLRWPGSAAEGLPGTVFGDEHELSMADS